MGFSVNFYTAKMFFLTWEEFELELGFFYPPVCFTKKFTVGSASENLFKANILKNNDLLLLHA